MVTAGTSFDVVAVVLNWRDAARTLRCVEGLLLAENVARVLVVDNETDGSMRGALASLPPERVELIEITENRGFSGGVNEGLCAARDSDAVLVINSDALIDPRSVDCLIAGLRADEKAGIVAPRVLNTDGTVQTTGGRVSRVTGLARQSRGKRRVDYLSWACVLVRGELLRTVGLLDDSFFMYWEDVDYSLRARDSGYALVVVDSAVAHHELSASAASVGRRLASYYAWSLLRLGDKRGGLFRLRSRIGFAALLASRIARRDKEGIRAIVRGGRLSRPVGSAWHLVSDDSWDEPRRKTFLNGKWLAQQMTGTQRHATEIARRLVACEGAGITIVVPSDAEIPQWAERATVHKSRARGNLFEQVALPFASFGHTLVNLSGSSPLLKRRQIITLFDASVFRYGDTFSRAFTWWYKLLYRTAHARSKRLLTVSQFSRDDLADVLRLNPAHLTIASCGSEHFPSPPGTFVSPVDAPYVVFVGSLTGRKNLAGPLKVLASRGIRSAVVGTEGSSAIYASSGIPDDPHVVALGRLTDEEIADLLANAAAMVFPSRYEGFGLPVIEAQRVGCPVVCSRSSSLPEVAGEGALYFDPDEPDVAADLVERLIVDAQLRTTMIDRGRANALRYSWDQSADTVLRIIRDED